MEDEGRLETHKRRRTDDDLPTPYPPYCPPPTAYWVRTLAFSSFNSRTPWPISAF
jgi:hypothetical protein